MATRGLEELLEDAGKSAITDRRATTIYRNDNKGGELFERRFAGIQDIVRTVESSKEREIHGAVEAGVGTLSLLEFVLNVKARVGALGKRADREREAVSKALNAPLRMALAEIDLERHGEIEDAAACQPGGGAPFIRLGSELRPYPVDANALFDDLSARLGDAAAHTIVSRKHDYEKTWGTTRLVYAAEEPLAMAAIFIPPLTEEAVVGNTSVVMPVGSEFERVTFARRLDTSGGITFLDVYYIVDHWRPERGTG